LIQEALDHRRRRDLQERMSAAYAASAADPEERETLLEMQVLQDELLEREE